MSVVISTSGVCPSNRGNVFPNLARQEKPPADVVAEVTATAEAELKEAGIRVFILPFNPRSEVPSLAVGHLSMWGFERAWYYWRASGPGLPVEVAERLHATHGVVCRVAGNCGCPSPREWYKGFGTGDYHVDTQDGLNALAAALRSVWDESKEPRATEAI